MSSLGLISPAVGLLLSRRDSPHVISYALLFLLYYLLPSEDQRPVCLSATKATKQRSASKLNDYRDGSFFSIVFFFRFPNGSIVGPSSALRSGLIPEKKNKKKTHLTCQAGIQTLLWIRKVQPTLPLTFTPHSFFFFFRFGSQCRRVPSLGGPCRGSCVKKNICRTQRGGVVTLLFVLGPQRPLRMLPTPLLHRSSSPR